MAGLFGTAEINKILLNPDQSVCQRNKTPGDLLLSLVLSIAETMAGNLFE